jgi:hypothetical protein
MPYPGEERCFDGDKYRFVPKPSSEEEDVMIVEAIDRLGAKLDYMIELLEDQKWVGSAYEFHNVDVPASYQNKEFILNPPSRSFVLESSREVKVKLNDRNANEIIVRGIDSPLIRTNLPKSQAISTIFVTTGVDASNIRIISFSD